MQEPATTPTPADIDTLLTSGTGALACAHVIHRIASLKPKQASKTEETQPTPLAAIFAIRDLCSPLHIGIGLLCKYEGRCAGNCHDGQGLDQNISHVILLIIDGFREPGIELIEVSKKITLQCVQAGGDAD